jgi:hypothetical protein
MARHHCWRPACASAAGPANVAILPEYPRETAHPSFAASASRAADPDPVAGADHRPRDRALCLFAGAAGHARCAGLVVFGRGLHEHHQCGGLPPWRADDLGTHQAIRPVGHGALGNPCLRGVAGAVRAVGQFCRPELCPAARGGGRRGGIRRRRGAGGADRTIAADAGELSAQPVLRRTRPRHPRLRPDRAIRAAGIRTGVVVDRVVDDDAAHRRHDRSAVAGAARWR